MKPAPTPTKKTLIAAPLLFAKRDKRGKIADPPVWSESMLQQASDVWEEVLVFIWPETVVNQNLSNLVTLLGISNITVIDLPKTSTEELTNSVKKCIIDRGARIKPVKNPREVTYMNIRRHVDAPHMTWAGQDDHKKARIDLDKPKSFKDLQSERRLKSEWF